MNEMYERYLQLLKENNTTSYQVSKETGITQTTLSDWKIGRCVPKIPILIKIAKYFNVSLDWLAGLSKYKNEKELISSKTTIIKNKTTNAHTAKIHKIKIYRRNVS